LFDGGLDPGDLLGHPRTDNFFAVNQGAD
jgi:hypothetical protein